MKIRLFQYKDADELSKLIGKTVVESNSEDYSKKAITVLVEHFSPKNLIKFSKKKDILVAIEKNKIVGTITLDSNKISAMFVLPNQQGKGVGRKLIKRLEKLAQQKGLELLRVRSSLTAFEFYKKMGYIKTRRASNKFIGPIIWLKKEI